MKQIISALKWFFKKLFYLPAWILFKAWFFFLIALVLPGFLSVLILLILAWIFYSIYSLLFNFYTWAIN